MVRLGSLNIDESNVMNDMSAEEDEFWGRKAQQKTNDESTVPASQARMSQECIFRSSYKRDGMDFFIIAAKLTPTLPSSLSFLKSMLPAANSSVLFRSACPYVSMITIAYGDGVRARSPSSWVLLRRLETLIKRILM